MDADLQHPPEFIPEMIDAWRKGYNIVCTERIEDRGISFKRAISTCFYFLINKISTVPIDYNAADFRLMDHKVVDILRQMRERHRFLRGMVNWVGFRTIKLKFKCNKRLHGRTKYSLKKMVRFAIDGIVSFSGVPLIAAALLGFILAALSLLYGCFAIYQRFFRGNTPSGWASLLVSFLFLNGMVIFFLGVIGIYITAIHDEVKQRPVYIIRESAGIGDKA